VSKKKFKAGLESLFGDVGDDHLQGISPLLEEEEQGKTDTKPGKRKKKRSRKNFSPDLEDLFQSALEKEYKETETSTSMTQGRNTTNKKRKERPVIGIDALIRKTSTEVQDELGGISPLKKRVTLTLEKHKLEQLKSIAKSKKSYLKDVVDEIISQYLNKQTDPPQSAN